MSNNRDAFENIIAAVPDFQPEYQKFLAEWQDEDLPWYLAMGELAHYIVKMYEEGTTSQYGGFFDAIELILKSADTELQNLIWVGLFEDIQNIASHRTFGPDVFRPWLGPKGLIAWEQIERDTQKVADWSSKQQPRSAFDSEAALAQVENPDLRKLIEQMYRKTQ